MGESNSEADAKSALSLIEEAAQLLRAQAGTLAFYYLGTLPFVLGLLYFWSDMSQSATASSRCGEAALAVAVLFAWMKLFQALFAQRLKAAVIGDKPPATTARQVLSMATSQMLIHATGLFILPLCAVIMLPLAWCHAFYQNLLVGPADAETSVRERVASAWKQAEAWPKQNHLILAILFLFSIFVFLNISLALYLIPQLLKSFFAIDTVFTASAWAMLNTTFLFTVCGLTYLCVDPLQKTIYVLRVFYSEAQSTGADLRAELRRHARPPRTARAILGLPVALLLCGAMPDAKAEETATKPVSATELDRTIEEVLQRREYDWRMPRPKSVEGAEEPGLLKRFFDAVFGWMGRAYRAVVRFIQWLVDVLVPQGEPGGDARTAPGELALRLLLYVLIAAAACAIVVVLWRRGRPARRVVSIAVAATPLPNPADESVAPDQLPDEEWMALAGDYARRGDFRLAIRVVYLAILANLARRELIVLARFKSNMEYMRELQRRTHAQADAPEAFSANVAVFERVWYGEHPATEEMLRVARGHFERLSRT